jgi:hypothetical protein
MKDKSFGNDNIKRPAFAFFFFFLPEEEKSAGR